MFDGYFSNFDMFKHSGVKLLLEDQEILPNYTDFDFTVTNGTNGKLSASVTIYNLPINSLDKFMVVCNNHVVFIAQQKYNERGEVVNPITITANTNETTFIYTLQAEYNNTSIPLLLNKGDVIWYEAEVNGKKAKVFTTLKVTQSYKFAQCDTEEAKLKRILLKEGKSCFVINHNELIIDNHDAKADKVSKAAKDNKQSTIGYKDLLLLQVLETFGGEELTLISLFHPNLQAGKTLIYTPNNSKTPKKYSIISVTTNYKCNSGLIQNIVAKTGSRLVNFTKSSKKGTNI